MTELTLHIATISGTVALVGLLVAGFVALILGWIIHPYTVGGFTRWVQSPIQQFFARVGTSIGAAIFTVVGGMHLLAEKFPDSASPNAASQAAEVSRSSNSTDDPSAEPRPPAPVVTSPSVPPVARVEHPTPVRPTTQSIALPESPKTIPPKVTETRSADEVVEIPRKKSSSKPDSESIKPSNDSSHLRVAELRGELAALETKIQSERARWQEGVNVINRLTNFKRTPVREGSPQYHQCMAASRVIQEVEAVAPALKAEKARLEAMIQSLEPK